MPKVVDDVWCPSTYVQNLYVEAGMPKERTFVLPWGVDPAIYNAGIPASDIGSQTAFVFLFVGGAIWRKGIDKLLDAYLAEFQRTDDVALIIKGFGSTTFYAQENANQRIIDLIKRTDVPVITFSEETFSDSAMATLYKRADVLVLPYRGEGFGMPVLEAMACGTPVIVTDGGATDDFVDAETGWRVPAKRQRTDVKGEELVAPGWTLEMDQMDLQRALRHAFTHRDEVAAKGKRAAEVVTERYLWDHSADKALARLDEIAARPPLGADRRSRHVQQLRIQDSFAERRRRIDCGAHSRGCASRIRFSWNSAPKRASNATRRCSRGPLGWRGVMIEGGENSFAALKQNYAVFPGVTPVHAMITRENIVQLFEAANVPKISICSRSTSTATTITCGRRCTSITRASSSSKSIPPTCRRSAGCGVQPRTHVAARQLLRREPRIVHRAREPARIRARRHRQQRGQRVLRQRELLDIVGFPEKPPRKPIIYRRSVSRIATVRSWKSNA